MASTEGQIVRDERRRARQERRSDSTAFQNALKVNPPPPAGGTRLTESLVWRDHIPTHMMPFPDQALVTESFERWMGWWYWHLDYYDETGCFKIRYVADIQYIWNPGCVVLTMPWLHRETTIKVKRVKNRSGWRSALMMVENGDERQDWARNVLWRLEIIGCYMSEEPGR